MTRLVTYPILLSTATVCAEPVARLGVEGLGESLVRFGAAVLLILRS